MILGFCIPNKKKGLINRILSKCPEYIAVVFAQHSSKDPILNLVLLGCIQHVSTAFSMFEIIFAGVKIFLNFSQIRLRKSGSLTYCPFDYGRINQ